MRTEIVAPGVFRDEYGYVIHIWITQADGTRALHREYFAPGIDLAAVVAWRDRATAALQAGGDLRDVPPISTEGEPNR